MSMIPHGFMPRSMMNMEEWTKPMDQWTKPLEQLSKQCNAECNRLFNQKSVNTLDMFDPFDALDHTIGRNMQWLNQPEFMTTSAMMPKVPQKYRITLDCVGYSPKSIKTEFIEPNMLRVCACEETKWDNNEDFHKKEFKKTYTLPKNAEWNKLVSFMTQDGHLVIEMPLKETPLHQNMDLFPKVIDTAEGGKQMQMKFMIPDNILPEHVHINIKDRCLIVKAEEKKVKSDGVSTFHYYKKTTLPENTDWKKLKCSYDNHQIAVCAPLNLQWNNMKRLKFEDNGVEVPITTPVTNEMNCCSENDSCQHKQLKMTM